eukprot:2903728-Prymnesium_polylepis.1
MAVIQSALTGSNSNHRSSSHNVPMTAFDLVVRDEVFLRDKFDISACIESALAWQQTDPLGGVAKQLNTQQQQLANAYRGALFGDLSKKALASSDGAAALYPLCCSSVGCVAND